MIYKQNSVTLMHSLNSFRFMLLNKRINTKTAPALRSLYCNLCNLKVLGDGIRERHMVFTVNIIAKVHLFRFFEE